MNSKSTIPAIPSTDVPWLFFEDQSAWDAVLPLGREVFWPRKAIVRHPGDDANSIFLIRSGTLKVAAGSCDGLQRTLWFMGAGSLLGEAAMFSGKPYQHYVTAVEDSAAVEFAQDVVLDHILGRHPELSRLLLVNLAAKSYITSTQVEDVAFLTAPQRIGRFLFGFSQARDSLQLPLTHTTIAELLGIHRVTVSNALGAFRRIGILDETEHCITLKNIEALQAFVSDPSLVSPQV